MDVDHLPLSERERGEVRNFGQPGHLLRRLFSELLGTYFLVLVAVAPAWSIVPRVALWARAAKSSLQRSWLPQLFCLWARFLEPT